MSSITIYLTNSSGVPLSGQIVKLRRAGLDNFGTDYLTMVDVAGKPGKYKTVDAYVSDRYKVWVNGAEDESFGGPDGLEITLQSDILLKSGGTMTGNIAMGNNRITGLPSAVDNSEPLTKGQGANTYMPLSGGTFAGNVAMSGNTLSGLPDATTDSEPVTKGQAEDDYGQLAANNVWGGSNTFAGQVAHSTVPPLCDVDPTNDHHLSRRAWVLQQINNAAVPYQESVNVIRLMPEGSDQTNKVYNTWAKATNAARLLAGDLRRMTVEIRGAGTAGATIVPNDGGISGNNAFNSYVSYKGINHNILLELSGTVNMSVSLGTSLVSDLTFLCEDPDAEITFNGFIFNNVFFDIQNATSLEFISCEFRNCIIKQAEGTTTYTTSKGSGVTTNTDMPDTISGWGGKNIDDM